MQRTREQLAREEEEESEKARREVGGRREVTVVVKIIRRSEENIVRPVTRCEEDGNLKISDQDVTLESDGLEALQHTTSAETDNTPPPPHVDDYSTT